MKMTWQFCGVRTSSFGLVMRDLLRLGPRLEIPVAFKSAFEDTARTSPRWGIRLVARGANTTRRSPSRGIRVSRVDCATFGGQVQSRASRHSNTMRAHRRTPRLLEKRDAELPCTSRRRNRSCADEPARSSGPGRLHRLSRRRRFTSLHCWVSARHTFRAALTSSSTSTPR